MQPIPSPQPSTIVRCPHCKKSVRWDESNPFRPFCSKRCQMVDFGDWASETHRLPGQPADSFPSPDDTDTL